MSFGYFATACCNACSDYSPGIVVLGKVVLDIVDFGWVDNLGTVVAGTGLVQMCY